MRNTNTNGRCRTWGWILLVLYFGLLVYFLLFCKAFGRTPGTGSYRLNLVPFREIHRFYVYWKHVGIISAFLNMAGNLIGFVPLGFLVPLVAGRKPGFIRMAKAGFIVSLIMESLQLVLRAGIFDVDDLILNTLGTLVGYIVYLIFNRFGRYNIYG